MLTHSLILLAAVASAGPQSPPSVAPQERPRPVEVDDPKGEEVAALDRKFSNDLAEYGIQVYKLKKAGAPESEWPEHPSRRYLPKYEELAREGSGLALVWMVENVHHMDEDVRTEKAQWAHDLLVRDFVDQPYMLHVAENVPRISTELGETYALGWCDRVVAASSVAEVQARAFETKAKLIAKFANREGRPIPPDVRETYRIIVDGYAGTETARRAASTLYARAELDLVQALRRWLREVERSEDSGGSSESWPECPLHEFKQSYVPLANVGYMEAVYWVEVLYPHYVSAEERGRVQGIAALFEMIGNRYLPANKPWTDLRFGILEFLLAEYPGEPRVEELLGRFVEDSSRYDLEHLELVFRPIVGPEGPPALRPYAQLILGQALAGGQEWAQLEEAAALFDAILAENPDHPVAAQARIAKARFGRIMPGNLAPDFRTADQHGLEFRLSDYRGRVVLITFGGFWNDEWTAALPERCRLAERLRERPLSLIDVNTDNILKKKLTRRLENNGVTWRVSLQFSQLGPLLVDWGIETFPTTIVVDAEGTIRGRNLPWEQTVALIEELLPAAEKN